jgi:pimeloyl-ACP methyl ester carboxylesterase
VAIMIERRRRPVRTGRVAALVVGLALLAGCAGSTGDRGPAAASGSSTGSSPTPSPSVSTHQVDPNGFPLAERPDCAADAGGTFVRATTSEGNGVGFLLIGTGPAGVVLGPQDNGDICQWLPYAEELATTYRVALFDWDEPRSELPLLAAAALRHAGVTQVVLGGASYGGALALSEAYRVRPRLAGVLSFSGELTLPGLDGRAGIRKWRGPLLALGSEQDDFFDSQNARQLRRLHPGAETIVMVPGHAHGVDLLDDPRQARVRAAADRFLARVLG